MSNIETERRFLVSSTSVPPVVILGSPTDYIEQGYLSSSDNSITRVRAVKSLGSSYGLITIKSRINERSCHEYEYEIPYSDSIELLKLCNKVIKKYRTTYLDNDHQYWHIDYFINTNSVTLEDNYIFEIEAVEDYIDSIALPDFYNEDDWCEVTGEDVWSNESISEKYL